MAFVFHIALKALDKARLIHVGESFERGSEVVEVATFAPLIQRAQLRREGDSLRVDLSRDELKSLVEEQEIGRVSYTP